MRRGGNTRRKDWNWMGFLGVERMLAKELGGEVREATLVGM